MSSEKDRYGQPLKRPKKPDMWCRRLKDGDKKHSYRRIMINYMNDNPSLYKYCVCNNLPRLYKIEMSLRKKLKIRRQKLMKKREQEIAPMGL